MAKAAGQQSPLALKPPRQRPTLHSPPAPPHRPICSDPHGPRSFQLLQARRLCVKSTGTCIGRAVGKEYWYRAQPARMQFAAEELG